MDGALPDAAAGTPDSRTGPATAVLALLALVAALYLARAFFIPLLIGILASYALRPAVDWLGKCRVPRAVAAALVLAAVVAGLSWIAFSLSDDAAAMVEKLPDAARKVRRVLSESRAEGPTALQNMQAAAKELEGAASDAAGGGKAAPRTSAARDTAPTDQQRLKELKAINTWERAAYIEKGGWDRMPGEEKASDTVARPCADGLGVLMEKSS